MAVRRVLVFLAPILLLFVFLMHVSAQENEATADRTKREEAKGEEGNSDTSGPTTNQETSGYIRKPLTINDPKTSSQKLQQPAVMHDKKKNADHPDSGDEKVSDEPSVLEEATDSPAGNEKSMPENKDTSAVEPAESPQPPVISEKKKDADHPDSGDEKVSNEPSSPGESTDAPAGNEKSVPENKGTSAVEPAEPQHPPVIGEKKKDADHPDSSDEKVSNEPSSPEVATGTPAGNEKSVPENEDTSAVEPAESQQPPVIGEKKKDPDHPNSGDEKVANEHSSPKEATDSPAGNEKSVPENKDTSAVEPAESPQPPVISEKKKDPDHPDSGDEKVANEHSSPKVATDSPAGNEKSVPENKDTSAVEPAEPQQPPVIGEKKKDADHPDSSNEKVSDEPTSPEVATGTPAGNEKSMPENKDTSAVEPAEPQQPPVIGEKKKDADQPDSSNEKVSDEPSSPEVATGTPAGNEKSVPENKDTSAVEPAESPQPPVISEKKKDADHPDSSDEKVSDEPSSPEVATGTPAGNEKSMPENKHKPTDESAEPQQPPVIGEKKKDADHPDSSNEKVSDEPSSPEVATGTPAGKEKSMPENKDTSAVEPAEPQHPPVIGEKKKDADHPDSSDEKVSNEPSSPEVATGTPAGNEKSVPENKDTSAVEPAESQQPPVIGEKKKDPDHPDSGDEKVANEHSSPKEATDSPAGNEKSVPENKDTSAVEPAEPQQPAVIGEKKKDADHPDSSNEKVSDEPSSPDVATGTPAGNEKSMPENKDTSAVEPAEPQQPPVIGEKKKDADHPVSSNEKVSDEPSSPEVATGTPAGNEKSMPENKDTSAVEPAESPQPPVISEKKKDADHPDSSDEKVSDELSSPEVATGTPAGNEKSMPENKHKPTDESAEPQQPPVIGEKKKDADHPDSGDEKVANEHSSPKEATDSPAGNEKSVPENKDTSAVEPAEPQHPPVIGEKKKDADHPDSSDEKVSNEPSSPEVATGTPAGNEKSVPDNKDTSAVEPAESQQPPVIGEKKKDPDHPDSGDEKVANEHSSPKEATDSPAGNEKSVPENKDTSAVEPAEPQQPPVIGEKKKDADHPDSSDEKVSDEPSSPEVATGTPAGNEKSMPENKHKPTDESAESQQPPVIGEKKKDPDHPDSGDEKMANEHSSPEEATDSTTGNEKSMTENKDTSAVEPAESPQPPVISEKKKDADHPDSSDEKVSDELSSPEVATGTPAGNEKSMPENKHKPTDESAESQQPPVIGKEKKDPDHPNSGDEKVANEHSSPKEATDSPAGNEKSVPENKDTSAVEPAESQQPSVIGEKKKDPDHPDSGDEKVANEHSSPKEATDSTTGNEKSMTENKDTSAVEPAESQQPPVIGEKKKDPDHPDSGDEKVANEHSSPEEATDSPAGNEKSVPENKDTSAVEPAESQQPAVIGEKKKDADHPDSGDEKVANEHSSPKVATDSPAGNEKSVPENKDTSAVEPAESQQPAVIGEKKKDADHPDSGDEKVSNEPSSPEESSDSSTVNDKLMSEYKDESAVKSSEMRKEKELGRELTSNIVRSPLTAIEQDYTAELEDTTKSQYPDQKENFHNDDRSKSGSKKQSEVNSSKVERGGENKDGQSTPEKNKITRKKSTSRDSDGGLTEETRNEVYKLMDQFRAALLEKCRQHKAEQKGEDEVKANGPTEEDDGLYELFPGYLGYLGYLGSLQPPSKHIEYVPQESDGNTNWRNAKEENIQSPPDTGFPYNDQNPEDLKSKPIPLHIIAASTIYHGDDDGDHSTDTSHHHYHPDEINHSWKQLKPKEYATYKAYSNKQNVDGEHYSAPEHFKDRVYPDDHDYNQDQPTILSTHNVDRVQEHSSLYGVENIPVLHARHKHFYSVPSDSWGEQLYPGNPKDIPKHHAQTDSTHEQQATPNNSQVKPGYKIINEQSQNQPPVSTSPHNEPSNWKTYRQEEQTMYRSGSPFESHVNDHSSSDFGGLESQRVAINRPLSNNEATVDTIDQPFYLQYSTDPNPFSKNINEPFLTVQPISDIKDCNIGNHYNAATSVDQFVASINKPYIRVEPVTHAPFELLNQRTNEKTDSQSSSYPDSKSGDSYQPCSLNEESKVVHWSHRPDW